MGRRWEDVPPSSRAKIDQDLAAARDNLAVYQAFVQRHINGGDSAEKVFAMAASDLLREHRDNPEHLAIGLAAAVLALFERGQREETTTGFYFVSTSFRAVSVIHRPCNQTAGVIHNYDEPDLDQFRQVAAEHLRGCEA